MAALHDTPQSWTAPTPAAWGLRERDLVLQPSPFHATNLRSILNDAFKEGALNERTLLLLHRSLTLSVLSMWKSQPKSKSEIREGHVEYNKHTQFIVCPWQPGSSCNMERVGIAESSTVAWGGARSKWNPSSTKSLGQCYAAMTTATAARQGWVKKVKRRGWKWI